MNVTKYFLARIGNALRSRYLSSAIVSAVVLGTATCESAHATSFPCRPEQSKGEALICKDPQLSKLDDTLAVAYREAIDVAQDRDALEADRVSQWQWRQTNCSDRECLKNWYERRIGELGADIAQGRQAEDDKLRASLFTQDLTVDAQEAVLKLKNGKRRIAVQ